MWGPLCVSTPGMHIQFHVRSVFHGTVMQSVNHYFAPHVIIGKGIPNRLASANNHAQPLSSALIPSAEDAVSSHGWKPHPLQPLWQ